MEAAKSTFPLVELHAHLGTSIHPAIYWRMAQAQGFKLPTRDYHEFIKHITLSSERNMTLNDYLFEIYHPLLDPLSSGTFAVEEGVYETMSGAYRNGITTIELRANPMKHNNSGRDDLDYIILAMLRGMERALLEYPKLKAGIILCLDRTFNVELNAIIIEKAIKYRRRGIVGIDFAGPASKKFKFADYVKSVSYARLKGLGITAHSGEVREANDMWEALTIKPHRIGHGIYASRDKKLMREIVKRNIVLEVCPMSNIATHAVENIDELRDIIRTLIDNNVLFTINTDWPEMIPNAHLWRQLEMLEKENILSQKEIKQSLRIAQKATFIQKAGIEAYI